MNRTFLSVSMQKTNLDSVWQLFAGIFIAELGMLLIAFGAWDALKSETRILIYVGGVLLFLVGLVAIQIDAIRWPAVKNDSGDRSQA